MGKTIKALKFFLSFQSVRIGRQTMTIWLKQSCKSRGNGSIILTIQLTWYPENHTQAKGGTPQKQQIIAYYPLLPGCWYWNRFGSCCTVLLQWAARPLPAEQHAYNISIQQYRADSISPQIMYFQLKLIGSIFFAPVVYHRPARWLGVQNIPVYWL